MSTARLGRLGVPFVISGQFQQEVPHNLMVAFFAAYVLPAIAKQNTPPGSPGDMDVYIVGSAGSGDWDGQDNKIAYYFEGTWRFFPDVDDDNEDIAMGADLEGLSKYLQSTSAVVTWSGSAWV